MSALLLKLQRQKQNRAGRKNSSPLKPPIIQVDQQGQNFTMASTETSSLLQNEGAKKKPVVDRLSWSQALMSSHSFEHNDVTAAAYLLRDAIILSKDTTLFAHTDYLISGSTGASSSAFSKFSRRILIKPIVTNLLSLSVIALVAISFLEPPNWCRNFVPYGDDSDLGTGCDAALYMKGTPAFYVDDTENQSQYYYPSMRIDYLNAQQAFLLECFLVFFILLHTLLCIAKDDYSLKNYLMLNFTDHKFDQYTTTNTKSIRVFRIIRFVSLIFLTKGLLSEMIFTSTVPRAFAVYLRILLFISYSEGIQKELLIAGQLLPNMASVGTVLFMVIAFYGLIGVAAFYGTKEGDLHFSNWVEAIWTLWTSMTTVIYPDVMMAGFNQNRFVPLYFISFMIFTFFFLLNVMLGVVVDGYNHFNKARQDEIEMTRKGYLKDAFNYLTSREGKDHVTYTQMMAVFLTLNEECYEIPNIPQDRAEVLFALLDQDGTEQLQIDEFINFTTVMLLEFEEVRPTWLESVFPSIVNSNRYDAAREFISSAKFDFTIDLMILLNAFSVIAQSYPELAGVPEDENSKTNDGMIDTPWEVAELIFTLVYAIEMLSKIMLMGWKEYSSTVRNLFDGFVTVLAIVAMFIVYYPNSYDNSHLIRFIVMSRVIRVFRLFMVIKPFRVMARTFVGVLPAAGRISLLLFSFVYIFSAIGMQNFGGKLTRDPNNQMSYLLEGTDYAENFYWANNFNDLLSGMNVCFNLLVINNWNEMETGLIAVTSKYCRYFLFFFFVCGVIIVNNLVVAVVIESFVDELAAKEVEEEEEANGGLKKLVKGRFIHFDGEKLPEGRNQKKKYIARMRPGLTGEEEKKMLGKLIS